MNDLLRVLLIEDSDLDVVLLLHALKRGYEVSYEQVRTATETARALDRAKEGRTTWDLIIADIDLPGFSGITALEMARERGLDLPLLIVSGHQDEATALAAMRAGAHDYFIKGHLDRLLPAIERELREAQERRARRAAEARFRGLVEAAPDALVIVNAAGDIVLANSQAEQLFGYPAETLKGQPVEVLMPERYRERHRQHREQYMQDPRVRPMGAGLDLFGQHQDGSEFAVEISLSLLNTPEGVLVSSAIRDISERKRAEAELRSARQAAEQAARAARKTADRIGRLQAISAALVEALTPAEVAQAIIQHAVPALEAGAGIVALLTPEGDEFRLAAFQGYSVEHVEGWRRFPVSANVPVAEAVRQRQPVLIRSRAEFRRRYPQHTLLKPTYNAWAAVPLIVEGQPVGGLGLSFPDPQAFGLADQEYLNTVARQCALALARSRLYEAEQRMNAELDQRVQERTRALQAATEALQEEVAERRRAQQKLAAAREEERERIAREIHDELGSALTILKMDVGRLERVRVQDEAELRARLADMRAMLDATVEAVRRVAAELHPMVLEEQGLRAALEWQFEQFLQWTGLDGEFVAEVDAVPLAGEAAMACFRIFQEALTNVARHAEADWVEARVWQEDDELRLRICDNGRGLPAEVEAGQAGRQGLAGMHERARLLGARLDISSPPAGGTIVQLAIPLSRAAGAEKAE